MHNSSLGRQGKALGTSSGEDDGCIEATVFLQILTSLNEESRVVPQKQQLQQQIPNSRGCCQGEKIRIPNEEKKKRYLCSRVFG